MTSRTIRLDQMRLGGGGGLFLIAGPCVIESEEHTLRLAAQIKRITGRLKVPWIFKASFDKANRSSPASYRGPGLERGLAILAAARTGRIVNIKKGQFMAPADMRGAVDKATSTGNRRLILTERGTSFGYNNLVVDMRAFPILQSLGYPVVFDATHSVQRPGGLGDRSGGEAQFIGTLSRAAVAAGVDGLFLEVHERPERALSDGPNSLPLRNLEELLSRLVQVRQALKASRRRQGRRG